MSYIGSSAAPIPVAFSGVRTQSFSGNGSTSLFTLNRAVSAVTAIEVVVNNVQQSPFDGSYSIVNNGVGLQFSENVSAGTNNIYVTYRDQAIGSLYDTGAVRKAGDVMSGSLSINGAASSTSLVIGRGDTSLEGGQLDLCRASDNLAAWGIDVYGSGNTPVLRVIDNIAAAVRLQIDGSGRMLVPSQPVFHVNGNGYSARTSGTYSAANSSNSRTILTNIGGCFNAANDRFTAPIAGTYEFTLGSCNGGTGGSIGLRLIKNSATELNYQLCYWSAYQGHAITAIASLAANDYVEGLLVWNNGTNGDIYTSSLSGRLIG